MMDIEGLHYEVAYHGKYMSCEEFEYLLSLCHKKDIETNGINILHDIISWHEHLTEFALKNIPINEDKVKNFFKLSLKRGNICSYETLKSLYGEIELSQEELCLCLKEIGSNSTDIVVAMYIGEKRNLNLSNYFVNKITVHHQGLLYKYFDEDYI